MRWVRYNAAGETSFGILTGDEIEQVAGSPFGEHKKTGKRVALAAAKLAPPVIPVTFYAAGLNYRAHITDESRIPKRPDIGYRANNALIGADEAIVIPAGSCGRVQYEGELVAVVGKQAKHLTAANALDCIFGYTIGNDVSERVWQRGDRTLWRAKNSDTFKPMGPWIETEVDVDAMWTEVRLNGTRRSHFKTNSMIFDLPTYLVEMTRVMTLYPGDVIWLGTDGATPDMQDGDVCEIEITGIGVLRNPVVLEKPAA
jgi:2-keto-4-pentenoate hydratase/2-oxohepta-3-ene-1,7-dioic acid hydratase in catechol pathway